MQSRFVVLLLLLGVSQLALGARRVRCPWVVGAAAYYNATLQMESIGLGTPSDADVLKAEAMEQIEQILGGEKDFHIFAVEMVQHTHTDLERVHFALEVLDGAMEQTREGIALHPNQMPRSFVVDPSRPKSEDLSLIKTRIGLVSDRLREAKPVLSEGKRPETMLAPPFLTRGDEVLEVSQLFLSDETSGVAFFESAPRRKLKGAGLKIIGSLALMGGSFYMGATGMVPPRVGLVMAAGGSIPGFVGFVDGLIGTLMMARNGFARDKIDIRPFENFAMRASYGRARPGSTAWIYAKDRNGWEADLFIHISPHGTPYFVSLVTRPH